MASLVQSLFTETFLHYPPPESEAIAKRPLRLKDPQVTPYVIRNTPSPEPIPRGDGGGSEATSHVAHVLPEDEKAALERAGRTIVARELKEKGYSVEEMPSANPGFDLRATGVGGELRVEVKAHTGRARVAELTHRQYKEYLSQHGYCWELWNVEHLAEDDYLPPTINFYNNIPDDALDVRTFRVDLTKCHYDADGHTGQ